MYRVTGINVPDDAPIRAGRPFDIGAEIVCEGENCPEADVTISIDGATVVQTAVALNSGEAAVVGPVPDAPEAAAEFTTGDSTVTVKRAGRRTITVTVATDRLERVIEVGPMVTPVDPGEAQLR